VKSVNERKRIVWPGWLPLALGLIGFALYMWRIDARSIWWDESLSLYRAQRDISYILSGHIDFPGIETIDQHPPLYFLLLRLFVRFAGESDLTLRLPSALFSLLNVALLYALGRYLWNYKVGLVAMVLGVLSPFYLWYAQEARMYTMVTALGSLSLYALWRGLNERGWGWAVLWGVAAAAALLTQYLSFLFLLCQGVLAVLLWPRRIRGSKRSSRSRWLWGGMFLIFLLGGVTYQIVRLIPSLQSFQRHVPLWAMFADVLNSFSLGLSVNLRWAWPLDLVFGLVYLGGVVALWHCPPHLPEDVKGWRFHGVILMFGVGYILFPLLLIWGISLFIPLYKNSRYIMMASPAFYLTVAVGVWSLERYRRWLGNLIFAILLLSMGFSVARYSFCERYQSKEEYRQPARLIERNERVGDVILVNGPESLTAFMHYYRGELPVVALPEGGLSLEQLDQRLRRLAAQYDRIWLLRARTEVSDPQRRVQHWFQKQTMQLLYKGYPSSGFYIALSAHLAKSPLVDRPIQGQRGIWDRILALKDFSLRYRDTAGRVQVLAAAEAQAAKERDPIPAGKVLSAELFLEPLDHLEDYKTSLRLVREGIVWAQKDQLPFMYFATSEWPVNKVVRYEPDVPIPVGTPPGRYALQLWFYRVQDGTSLEFYTPEGECLPYAPLGWVFVGKRRGDEKLFLPSGVKRFPLPITFGNRFSLLAAQVLPKEVRQGDMVVLDLYWQAKTEKPGEYLLVVNWQDSEGHVWHSETRPLAGVNYPTIEWEKGEQVRGILKLPLPQDAPLGPNTVHLLVYAPQRTRFLWIRRGVVPWPSRDVVVDRITIVPLSSKIESKD